MSVGRLAGRGDVKREDAAAWGGVLKIGDDKARLAEMKDEHDWYWNTFFLPFGQGYANCLIGNVDEVSREIEDAQKRLGFTETWLQFGPGHLDSAENEEMLQLFADMTFLCFSDKAPDGTFV